MLACTSFRFWCVYLIIGIKIRDTFIRIVAIYYLGRSSLKIEPVVAIVEHNIVRRGCSIV